MTRYDYYIVESNFAARVNEEENTAERLLPDGTWTPYDDVWEICTNGRWVETEAAAIDRAKKIFELHGETHALG